MSDGAGSSVAWTKLKSSTGASCCSIELTLSCILSTGWFKLTSALFSTLGTCWTETVR